MELLYLVSAVLIGITAITEAKLSCKKVDLDFKHKELWEVSSDLSKALADSGTEYTASSQTAFKIRVKDGGLFIMREICVRVMQAESVTIAFTVDNGKKQTKTIAVAEEEQAAFKRICLGHQSYGEQVDISVSPVKGMKFTLEEVIMEACIQDMICDEMDYKNKDLYTLSDGVSEALKGSNKQFKGGNSDESFRIKAIDDAVQVEYLCFSVTNVIGVEVILPTKKLVETYENEEVNAWNKVCVKDKGKSESPLITINFKVAKGFNVMVKGLYMKACVKKLIDNGNGGGNKNKDKKKKN